ncbi:MAG: hypothetical protein K2G35_07835, partial [Duncaniella sp.]|nr:hypothetical protein [Duncaniella sp.]
VAEGDVVASSLRVGEMITPEDKTNRRGERRGRRPQTFGVDVFRGIRGIRAIRGVEEARVRD